MTEHLSTPSASEARALLERAEGMGASATRAAAWPTALLFTGLAILGSVLMIGFQIVAHTGYGAPLLAGTAGAWAAILATSTPFLQRTTKRGFSKRFLGSLLGYFALYAAALLIGGFAFPDGNLAYYLPAAVVLAAAGLLGAARELRA